MGFRDSRKYAVAPWRNGLERNLLALPPDTHGSIASEQPWFEIPYRDPVPHAGARYR